MALTSLSGYIYRTENPVTTANIERCLPEYPQYDASKKYVLKLIPNTTEGAWKLTWVEESI